MTTSPITINPMITIPFVLNNETTIGTEYIIKEKKIDKKERRKIFDFESKEAERFANKGRISDNLYHDIERMSRGNKLVQLDFISKGIETNQWIRFAIYYMTDPLAKQIMFADTESRELVNGIATLAGFGKVYESEGIADINLIDSSQLGFSYTGRFLLNKTELVDFLSTPYFQAVMHSKIVRRQEILKAANAVEEQKYLDGTVTEIIPEEEKKSCYNPAFDILTSQDNNIISDPLFIIRDDPDSIIPIEFGSKEAPIVPKRGANIPADVYDKFENIFRYFLPETTRYHYENINGFYYLYITRKDSGAEEYYILDDGSIMGGKEVSILANYINNGMEVAIFVNIKRHPSIASRVLEKTLFNYLTPEEVVECKSDYLYNSIIYNNFDFHNTEFYDTLDAKQKYDFEVALLGIMELDITKNVRMRFEEFIDSTHFTVVSDFFMYKPLPYIQNKVLPDTYILDGLIIRVDNDVLFVEYNGEVKKFRMGK